jgi:hypothetical protein
VSVTAARRRSHGNEHGVGAADGFFQAGREQQPVSARIGGDDLLQAGLSKIGILPAFRAAIFSALLSTQVTS